jgi:hypothetical protein
MDTKPSRFGWAALLFLGTFARADDLADFSVSVQLLKQFIFTAQETDPFLKKGRMNYPQTEMRLTPVLGDSESGVKFYLNMDLKGPTVSTGSNNAGKRHKIDSTVEALLDANFKQELSLNEKGLNLGPFSSRIDITPIQFQVSNDFRLLNRFVNRKALETIPKIMEKELPTEKQELREKLESEVKKGILELKGFMDKDIGVLSEMFANKEKYPFDANLSTSSGPNGKIKFRFSEKGKQSQRTPKPEFESKQQILASGVVHQDLLTQMMAGQLAGKELKLSQLKKLICRNHLKHLINFCSSKEATEAEDFSIVFDKTNPIQYVFEQGKIILRMNASYRSGVEKSPENQFALLNDPEKSKSTFETIPYKLEVIYQLDNGTAKLDKLSVTNAEPGNTNLSAIAGDLFGNKKQHTEEAGKTNHPNFAGVFLGPVVKAKLDDAFRKIFSEKLEFETMTIPTKGKLVKGPEGNAPQITEYGSLLPISVKSEKGWLAIGSTFCNEAHRTLGVVLTVGNTVASVESGSPADFAGFRPGDKIESFGEPESRATTLFDKNEPFIAFINQKALNKSAKDRRVMISGKDAEGKPFQRSVFLCPKGIKSR